MSNDNTLETALWLVVGGAAGYAAGRWWMAPHLAKPSTPTTTPAAPSATRAGAPAIATQPPRALASGPPSYAIPIDPYPESSAAFVGLPNDMQPIDPYGDAPPAGSSAVVQGNVPSAPSRAPTRPSAPIDGPITMPSQVDDTLAVAPPSSIRRDPGIVPPQLDVSSATSAAELTTSTGFATSSRVRRYDPVFERYRGTIPIEYVRALVERESDGDPNARTGSAIGLMQIVPVVLDDYNKRHGTSYRSEHLANPATNVAIGCELLHIILKSYRTNHPHLTTLQTDWDNPRFVELLTLGWNAGFSEAGGLGRVARYLEGLGAVDITIDQVSAHAQLAGATKHLSNPAKAAWCKSVVALYLRERMLARSFPSV